VRQLVFFPNPPPDVPGLHGPEGPQGADAEKPKSFHYQFVFFFGDLLFHPFPPFVFFDVTSDTYQAYHRPECLVNPKSTFFIPFYVSSILHMPCHARERRDEKGDSQKKRYFWIICV
jgi:hypothetical protein